MTESIRRISLLGIATAVLLVGVLTPVTAMAGTNIVVTLRGVGEVMASPPIAGALCYEAELVNTKTDRTIGSGIDCLEDIALHPGDSVALTRTTFFFFRQGTLAATGRTTVSPVFEGSSGPPAATHIVGDITGPGGDNILTELGTGRFRNRSGSVRLS